MTRGLRKIECHEFAGLELGGSKGARTTFISIKYYPGKKRIFIDKIVEKIQGDRTVSGDDRLIELLETTAARTVAVNSPLSLPPCIGCVMPECPGISRCVVPEVEYMRHVATQTDVRQEKMPTPYTQRAADVYLRQLIAKGLPVAIDVDETLGASNAPLTARFQYLRSHLPKQSFIEVNSKITTARLADWFGFSSRELRRYRGMEHGLLNRVFLLQKMEKKQRDLPGIPHLFLYETDMQLLAASIHAFDAFMAAMVCVYNFEKLTEVEPDEFAGNFNFITLPQMLRESRVYTK